MANIKNAELETNLFEELSDADLMAVVGGTLNFNGFAETPVEENSGYLIVGKDGVDFLLNVDPSLDLNRGVKTQQNISLGN